MSPSVSGFRTVGHSGNVFSHSLECDASATTVPFGMWLESVWRDLRSYEGIVSGCEVNRLIDWFRGERLPAVDLAHVDVTGLCD